MSAEISIKIEKPKFKQAMANARKVLSSAVPPATREEVFSVYRSSKNLGVIVFRSTFKRSE